ncbi:hypothetical protein ACFL17_06890 [Pseudomonadota bacterium]
METTINSIVNSLIDSLPIVIGLLVMFAPVLVAYRYQQWAHRTENHDGARHAKARKVEAVCTTMEFAVLSMVMASIIMFFIGLLITL